MRISHETELNNNKGPVKLEYVTEDQLFVLEAATPCPDRSTSPLIQQEVKAVTLWSALIQTKLTKGKCQNIYQEGGLLLKVSCVFL